MEHKPRVGLVLIRIEMHSRQELRAVMADVQSDVESITGRLSQEFDLRGPWIVDTPEALHACQSALRETDLDMVVLAYQTLAGEEYLTALLQALGSTPLVVWCYLPWRRFPQPASFQQVLRGSGPVGTFGALGVLRNLGASFFFTFGSLDDPRLIQDLRQAGRAARLRHMLRSARFGLVPGAMDGVQSAFVDEFRLMADFGPVIHQISAGEYARAADEVSGARVTAYLNQVRQQYNIAGIADETLHCAARAALALAQLAGEHRLNVLAVSETSAELNDTHKIRSALYPGLLAPAVLFQPVAELATATANYILHLLTGSPTMLMEMWFWDEPKNLVVGGHLGMQNPALSAGKVSLCPDIAALHSLNSPGVQMAMMARPGRVTLLQLRGTPDGWQAAAASGVCLEGQPWVDACSHAVVRLDAPVDHFLHGVAAVGAARHWILAYGSVIPQIEAFCQMVGVPLAIFQQ